jgi:surface polysaccharide O-acyltransferase-like enzyme
VIAIHTTPFQVPDGTGSQFYSYMSVFVNQMARFAVPFFFMISGYFWGIKIKANQPVIPLSLVMAKKIGLIFLFWSAIYLLPFNFTALFEYGVLGSVKDVYWHMLHLLDNPTSLIFEGTKTHLWFLTGLLCALFINALFMHFNRVKELIILSVGLYLLGILAKSYSNTPIGIAIDFNTRNGPFFSTLFFTSGFLLSGIEAKTKWLWFGLAIFIFGCLSHFAEIFVLWKYFDTTVYQDYVIGTYFMGLGATVIALSNHPFLRAERLANIGKYTLGIYAVHMLYVMNFRSLDAIFTSFMWEIGLVILVLILSILTIMILARYRFMRKFIM